MKIEEIDKKIIRCLQEDIPASKTPFADISENLNISEEELLHRIDRYLQTGIMRRMGAILYHRAVGFSVNSMCCWVVPESEIDSVGEVMASFIEVSHVFQRPVYTDWPYNLYTMIHAQSEEMLNDLARKLSHKTGVLNYKLLNSLREFKKTSMKYY